MTEQKEEPKYSKELEQFLKQSDSWQEHMNLATTRYRKIIDSLSRKMLKAYEALSPEDQIKASVIAREKVVQKAREQQAQKPVIISRSGRA